MKYIGRYINMDASIQRRYAMENQLIAYQCGERYERFAAVDGQALDKGASLLSAGELGCFLSHYHCLDQTAPADAHVHIIEDDVVFGPQTIPLLDEMNNSPMEACDILFTDVFVPLDMAAIFEFMAFYRAAGMIGASRTSHQTRMPTSIMYLDLKGVNFCGMTSYLVNARSRARLVELIGEELANGPRLPIDMLLRNLATEGKIRALCTIPFLTSFTSESVVATTLADRGAQPASSMAFFLLRSFFFVGKDESRLMKMGRSLTVSLEDDAYIDLLLESFKFIFSERFVSF